MAEKHIYKVRYIYSDGPVNLVVILNIKPEVLGSIFTQEKSLCMICSVSGCNFHFSCFKIQLLYVFKIQEIYPVSRKT